MRRWLLLVVVVLVTAGVATGASADKVATSPGRVLGLARSQYSVAWLSAPAKGHCGPTAHLWIVFSGATYNLMKNPDALCQGGRSGVTDLAVAGNRVVWLAYSGGNTRKWQLFTATPSSAEHTIELATSNAESNETPIVLGVGSSSVIPYSTGSTVKVLKANGATAFTWQAPGPVTNTTAYQGQVAVFVKGGKCYVLSPTGAVIATYTFRVGAVQEFALAGVGLVVELPKGKVEIHNGSSVRTVRLAVGAKMLDYQDGFVLYRVGNQIRALRIATGKEAFIRYGTFAALESNGMTYASGRKVGSIAWVTFTSAVNLS
jgi:hypothetical protein